MCGRIVYGESYTHIFAHARATLPAFCDASDEKASMYSTMRAHGHSLALSSSLIPLTLIERPFPFFPSVYCEDASSPVIAEPVD